MISKRDGQKSSYENKVNDKERAFEKRKRDKII